MKQKKRVNPQKRPATEADVLRARKVGQNEGLRIAWVLFFYALHDKFGFGRVRLERLWHAIENLSDSIAKQYITVDDLQQELAEAGLELVDSGE